MRALLLALLLLATITPAAAQTTRPQPQAPAGPFGALAVDSRTGAYGAAKGQLDQRTAQDRAMQACNSPGCRVVSTFANRCAVLYREGNRQINVFETRREDAISTIGSTRCRAQSGCQVLTSVCSGDLLP
jgi:hypothetical protein